MPIISPQHKIAYFPVPKVACTSLKMAMFALTNGHDFSKEAHGDKVIQKVFPTQDFADSDLSGLDGYWKIAVVRDPASRVISAYTNKLNKLTRLLSKRLAAPRFKLKLQADDIPESPPSLIEFCLRLEGYRQHFKPIRHHTDTFGTFLGTDLGYFDRVYRMEELDVLCADVTARTGQPFVLPHANPSKSVDRTMNAAATQALHQYCAPDYQYLSLYYTAPAP